MKKLFLLSTLIFSFDISANNLPENFSMYQTNFLFNCPEPEKCFAAFDQYMSSPEVAAEKFEVDFFAINHKLGGFQMLFKFSPSAIMIM